MPDLKELLGEKYTPEIEAELYKDYVPAANAAGEAKRLKKERDDAISRATALETEKMSSDELAKKQLDDAIADANAKSLAASKMMAKMELSNGLSISGADVSQYMDTIDLLTGDDPEKAKLIAAGLSKMYNDAVAVGVAKANKVHLDNNNAPEGRDKDFSKKSDAEAKLKAAHASGNMQDIMYYTRIVQEL